MTEDERNLAVKLIKSIEEGNKINRDLVVNAENLGDTINSCFNAFIFITAIAFFAMLYLILY